MSTTYTATRDDIIASALRKLNVLELGDTPDTATTTNAAMALNLMIKQWAVDGIKIWINTEITLPLVVSKTTYTIGPSGDLVTDRPMNLVQAWIRNISVSPNIDTPLMVLSREQYNTLGSKFSTGVSNSIYLEPGVTNSTVKVYLTPNSTTATNYQLHMVVKKQIDDISSGTASPQFPIEWYQSLVWGLADQLAIEYSVPANHRAEITSKAEHYMEKVSSASVETESSLFVPDMRMSYSNYA